MAGLIREDDIAEVREKARIDEVVSSYVTLRNAGGGSMKGLCPFHDERTPSFHVTPARQFFHCFGCGEGGDVIAFLMKIDGLGFVEAIERLGEKYGVQVRREDGEEPERPRGPARGRLIDAHNKAQEYYADQLLTPDALVARQFLSGRGFDQEAAAHFGVGFAPRGGEELLRHLRQKGFNDEELVVAGLIGKGRGYYDRFRGRLVWPIRDPSSDVIGFGARRIFDDDRIEAKYLNTPESPIYKKSQVLYGIDLARKHIQTSSQAVVVEGYTDVMACHLAGVRTAVAACGTSFSDEHAKLLRRFLPPTADSQGEVVLTFDGDKAGQAGALRVFKGSDPDFSAQAYVAVEPGGMDPCDLRLADGDAAVRELIARRTPLYRFVLDSIVGRYDLDRADGRVDALREAALLVSSIRDRSKVDAFARELAGIIGVDPDEARAEVRRAAARKPEQRSTPGRRDAVPEQAEQPRAQLPDLRDPRFTLERETLKLVLQFPQSLGTAADGLGENDFTHPTYRTVWNAVAAGGGPRAAASDPSWSTRQRDTLADPEASAAWTALSVEPMPGSREPDARVVAAHVYRLQEMTTSRRITDVKSKLQRTNPVENVTEYNRMFGELVALEQHRRRLREAATGAQA